MRKLKFVVIILFLSLFTVLLTSCKPKQTVSAEYAEGTELRLAVAHNNTKTTITFQDGSVTGTGLTLADGVTYQTDDLKPVWKELEKVMKVKFENVYSGKNNVQNEFKHWRSLDFDGVDIVVGNADDMAEDGKKGKLINLADYLDLMPNFSKFLEDNPIVYLSLFADIAEGSIYYAPYFDGYDDIEKYFMMRADWIELLLDGPGDFAASKSDKFGDICGEAVYEPYMPLTGSLEINSLKADGSGTEKITKSYETTYGNIVEYMNENVTDDTTGVELVNMLRGYIDEAYDNHYGEERSKLFTGYNACWDVDELVALLRAVVCNTFALTGQEATKVTGIFPREGKANRTSDLFSLLALFGVRGYESRHDYLFFDAEGNLVDARGSEDFIGGMDKLSTLYKEGLILQDFDLRTDAINKVMFQQNLGFMMYDYCQTQTIYNDDETTLEAAPDFDFRPVINPVAKWFDGSNVTNGVDQGTWMRFTESWRSVKTNGWCITSSCTGDALNAAIQLFDYMYSEEGRILMSYGPSAWRSGQTTLYKGEQIPELSDAALDELWTLAGGNYTNYARQYLGSTLPVGFIKDQGMEYQCTTENGKLGSAIVGQAIAKGVVKHVSPFISENLFYTMVPTILPTTPEEDVLIGLNGALTSSGIFSRSSDGYHMYAEVIKYGLGSGERLYNTYVTKMPNDVEDYLNTYHDKLGGEIYIEIKQRAWERLENYYNANLKE